MRGPTRKCRRSINSAQPEIEGRSEGGDEEVGNDLHAGPMNGAAENADIGTPRSSKRHISARVPPTNVMGAENMIPAMKRHTRSVWMFWATAQGIIKITARRSVEALSIKC